MKRPLRSRHLLLILVVLAALAAARADPVAEGEEGEEGAEGEEEEAVEEVTLDRATSTEQPPTTVLPEEQKTASTTPEITTTAAPPAREAPLYRLRDSKEETCILLEVDGLLVFTYKTTVDEERETDRFIPEEVATSGTCDEDSATLVLQWGSYKLLWDFFKTPGGEKWYVDRIELTFNTSEKIFEHTKIPGRVLTLSTPRNHRVLLFPTPVGWSFTCKKETPIDLSDHDDFSATLLLREFHLQPFIFKGDDFGPEHECSARGIGALIDETAPIAVGSTLAIVVLLTVTVYGIFRYFKVKKVQYDTME